MIGPLRALAAVLVLVAVAAPVHAGATDSVRDGVDRALGILDDSRLQGAGARRGAPRADLRDRRASVRFRGNGQARPRRALEPAHAGRAAATLVVSTPKNPRIATMSAMSRCPRDASSPARRGRAIQEIKTG